MVVTRAVTPRTMEPAGMALDMVFVPVPLSVVFRSSGDLDVHCLPVGSAVGDEVEVAGWGEGECPGRSLNL